MSTSAVLDIRVCVFIANYICSFLKMSKSWWHRYKGFTVRVTVLLTYNCVVMAMEAYSSKPLLVYSTFCWDF